MTNLETIFSFHNLIFFILYKILINDREVKETANFSDSKKNNNIAYFPFNLKDIKTHKKLIFVKFILKEEIITFTNKFELQSNAKSRLFSVY